MKHTLRGSTLAETLVMMLVAGIVFLAAMEALTLVSRLVARRAAVLVEAGRQHDGIFRLGQLLTTADSVRGAEGVQRQQFQRGGAVDEQEVVAIFYLVQRVPQKEFPALHADQFDPGAGQRLVGGENIAVFGVHQGVLHRHFADQGIVDSLGDRLVHAHSRSGIGLRIKITQEDALPGLRQGRGEIHTGGCFPHAAFLIHNRNGFCHVGTYFLKIPNKVEMLMLIYYSKRGRPLQGEKRKSREKEEKMFHVKQTAEKEPRMFHVKHPQPVTAKDGSPRAAAASAEHRRNREEYLR